MNKWTRLTLDEIAKGRHKCECPTHKKGIGLEGHHGIFGRKKAHPEYNVVENLFMLCNTCNAELRSMDNRKGRLIALRAATRRYGRAHMVAWLESLRAMHKDHSEIEWLLRELEGSDE